VQPPLHCSIDYWPLRLVIDTICAHFLCKAPGDGHHCSSASTLGDEQSGFAVPGAPIGREPMTVRTILSRKGSDVVTIAPTANLSEAVKLLGERRIGAIVVTGPDNRVAGILSERDIVRVIGERGHAALEENVGAVMTRKVVTCTETDTIAFIMERMTAGKFRHLPVVDQGRLTGVISIGDVVKFRVEEIEHETEALREYIATA
jgi:CBS domain-containing protein